MELKKNIFNSFSFFFPERAAKYTELQHKQRIFEKRERMLSRTYEAAKPSNYHKIPSGNQSGDSAINLSRGTLRDFARHLDENHDLAIGILDTLVNNVVGANGITIEPGVKTKGGKPNQKANDLIRNALKDATRRIDTTRSLPWAELQRQVARTMFRDGELLIQHVMGSNAAFKHHSKIPYSLELIEADYLPYDKMSRGDPLIIHGIEVNAWREAMAYYLYKEHPGDNIFYRGIMQETVRKDAENYTHLRFIRRLSQLRGVSALHGVINRLDDIKDYQESERIAARISAVFAGYIKRSADFQGAVAASTGDRSFDLEAGMIWDDLLPGEDVGTISSNRPSTQYGTFTEENMRCAAAGTGTSASSISKKYDGNYSSQRQELVETRPGYEKLTNYLIGMFYEPFYRRFIDMLLISNAVELPKNIDPESHYNFSARGPAMIWIDPLKEIDAAAKAIEVKVSSRTQVIRDRGDDPSVVNEQLELELEQDIERAKKMYKEAAPATNQDDTSGNDQSSNDLKTGTG